MDGADAVHETATVELPTGEEALTPVGALSVPTVAVAVPLPCAVK